MNKILVSRAPGKGITFVLGATKKPQQTSAVAFFSIVWYSNESTRLVVIKVSYSFFVLAVS